MEDLVLKGDHFNKQKFGNQTCTVFYEIQQKTDGQLFFAPLSEISMIDNKCMPLEWIRKVTIPDDSTVTQKIIKPGGLGVQRTLMADKYIIHAPISIWDNHELCVQAVKVNIFAILYIKNITRDIAKLFDNLYNIENYKNMGLYDVKEKKFVNIYNLIVPLIKENNTNICPVPAYYFKKNPDLSLPVVNLLHDYNTKKVANYIDELFEKHIKMRFVYDNVLNDLPEHYDNFMRKIVRSKMKKCLICIEENHISCEIDSNGFIRTYSNGCSNIYDIYNNIRHSYTLYDKYLAIYNICSIKSNIMSNDILIECLKKHTIVINKKIKGNAHDFTYEIIFGKNNIDIKLTLLRESPLKDYVEEFGIKLYEKYAYILGSYHRFVPL